MKEQLNNITRELQEITQKELTKEEQRKNDILYKKELNRYTNELITQEFEKGLENKETLKDIYNDLIMNDNDMKSYIIDALYSYKITITKKMKLANGETYKKEFVNFPFSDKDIYNDIEQLYYKTLKNIYNKYNLKVNIRDEEAKEDLEQLFLDYFKQYGYTRARAILHDINNKNVIVQATDKDQQEYIKKNYFTILSKIDRIYKINNDDTKAIKQARTQTTRRSTGAAKKGLLYGSLFGIGFIKELAKVSKK